MTKNALLQMLAHIRVSAQDEQKSDPEDEYLGGVLDGLNIALVLAADLKDDPGDEPIPAELNRGIEILRKGLKAGRRLQ